MKNIKAHFVLLSLVILILNLNSTSAYAIPFGSIFKGIGKVFKKGADEITEVGTKTDDLKGINKSEDLVATDQNLVKVTEDANYFGTNKINEIKNAKQKSILEDHNVQHIDKLVDAVDVSDIDINEFINESLGINAFRIFWWSGRVFRSSINYNTSKEDRIIIKCSTPQQDFYFTALLEKNKKWLLLSGNIKQNVNGTYSPPLKKQELIVIRDLDQFIMFSSKTPKGKNFPTNYFLIADNKKFVYEENIFGTDSPEYLINNAENKIKQSNNFCNKL